MARARTRSSRSAGADRARADRPAEDARVDGARASVETVHGVGPAIGKALRARGIATVRDLAMVLPRSYDDERVLTPIGDLEPGRHVITRGVVRQVRIAPPRRLEVVLDPFPEDMHADIARKVVFDELRLVWFHAVQGMSARFTPGARIRATGTVDEFRGRASMPHPEIGPWSEDWPKQISPRYPEIPGVAPRVLARAISSAVAGLDDDDFEDPVPESVRLRLELPTVAEAVRYLHAPPHDVDVPTLRELVAGKTVAHRALVFTELFLLQLALREDAPLEGRVEAVVLERAADHAREIAASLPFALTGAQSRAIDDVLGDASSSRPGRRLLQGDVGCGKTAVAAIVCGAVARSGHQAVIAAPTEILARQHAQVIGAWLAKFGVDVLLVTGGVPEEGRARIRERARAGDPIVIVGTHAVFDPKLELPRLAFVVVDEQQRFGVMERAALVRRLEAATGGTRSPHMLAMSATPIPRTLTLALLGDVKTTVIDELPPGRIPPVTRAMPLDRRSEAYAHVGRALAAGGQAFIVCPAVSSEDATVRDIDAVSRDVARALPGATVDIVHGRLPIEERSARMERFARGETDILVATTVVEVGVDVPRANVIVCEHAERFGLAQLHQLRGRVGRKGQRSACLLLHESESEDAIARLRSLVDSNDGFRIAEEDLRLRGPGEVLGLSQAGAPHLRYGDLLSELPLATIARTEVERIVAADPRLEREEHAVMARAIRALRERAAAFDAA